MSLVHYIEDIMVITSDGQEVGSTLGALVTQACQRVGRSSTQIKDPTTPI